MFSRENIDARPTNHQSRITNHRRRLVIVGVLALTIAAATAACSRPAGPRGWAGAQPVTVQVTGSQPEDLVLAAHKKTLWAIALPGGSEIWQFPPQDRNAYLLSETTRDRARQLLQDANYDGSLDEQVDSATVQGPNLETFRDNIAAASLPDEQKKQLQDLISNAASREKKALTGIKAFYGEIAVSDDGLTTYLTSYGGYVFALDTRSRESRWIVDLGDGIVGGVAADGDTVYVGTKGKDVYALNASDGTTKWKRSLGGEVWAAPTLDGDALYVTSLGGEVYRLHKDSGDTAWSFDGADSGIASRAVVSSGTVYAGAFDNHLYALDAESGNMKWSVDGGNWFWGTPLVDGDTVYAGNLDGKLYAVDAASGDKRWTFNAGSPVRSGPVMAADAIIVAARSGKVFKLDPDSGDKLGDEVKLQSRIESTMGVSGDFIYIVPRNQTLAEVNAEGDLFVGGFPLSN
jgi:outer membrane protein assembly factor BamB